MRAFLAVSVLALMAACAPATNAPAPEAKKEVAAAPGACADGSTRLEKTGLCQTEANALVGSDPNVRSPELPDCTWSVKEAGLPGDEALLYRAATCKGVTTTLAFAGGARRAELSYESSAVYGEAGKGRVVVALYGVDPDPQGALKAALSEIPAAQRGGCEIRKAGLEGWPGDAQIIAPKAGRTGACGPMGQDGKNVRYWRVRQGQAWFIDLGDKDSDIDAGNMQIVAKGADGTWKPKAL